MGRLGIVVIGRNEGERLVRCLRSVVGRASTVVYVDSGSSDGSIGTAGEAGAVVVRLDASVPFTAARARNAGFAQLLALDSGVAWVQFVDGDCEIVAGWLETAQKFLSVNSRAAVVCGRRRERFPERSIYNRLCDLEWDTPVGEVAACGGDAMMRVDAFKEVCGFRDAITAGEEPELCARLRAGGWSVHRLDADMTLHDANILRFRQWWRRTVRTGYGIASVSQLRDVDAGALWGRESRSNWLWGLLLPSVAGALAPVFPAALLLFAGYPILFFRVYRRRRRRGSAPAARLYACFCVLAKFPLAFGQMRFYRDRLLGRRGRLIEYKGVATQEVRS